MLYMNKVDKRHLDQLNEVRYDVELTINSNVYTDILNIDNVLLMIHRIVHLHHRRHHHHHHHRKFDFHLELFVEYHSRKS